MTEEQINESQSPKPGFMRRFLRALFKTLLALVIIAVLAVAGWFIFQELRRSFEVVNSRMDRQADQFASLQNQLETQAAQLQTVQTTVTGLDENLAGNLDELQVVVNDNKSDQDEVLSALTNEVDGLTSETETMSQTIATLNDGKAALEEGVAGLSSDLDAQGGEFDMLRADFEALQSSEAGLAENVATFEAELAAADPAGLRQAVLVFRLWEIVTRARLRLVEHNLGLAGDDVQLALAALSILQADSPELLVEPLQQIEERLLMATENLPDAPITAANDLDVAWQDLDSLLTTVLALEVEPTPTPAP